MEFVTWTYLASAVGQVAVVQMLVQFLKDLPGIKKMPTKYFTYIVAIALGFGCAFVIGPFKTTDIPLIVINAVIVTFAATGCYDYATKTVKADTVKTDQTVTKTVPEQDDEGIGKGA